MDTIQESTVQGSLDETISNFYNGTSILITGGTGFLGKALIEKLLWSCNVKTIYILVRTKRGMTAEQRCHQLCENLAFDRIRSECPAMFKKIKVVPGDVSLERLGLNEDNENMLINNVNIIFHSAATIRFNEPLTVALNLNTFGTKRLIDLAKNMTNLKSFVHISTAFSNCDKKITINEKPYPCILDPEVLLDLMKVMPENFMNGLEDKLKGDHPNTYTFTKCLAENLVNKYSSQLPMCIVRPSIVTPSVCEPFPGWLDNLYGSTGIILEVYRGTARSIVADEKVLMDAIPVDYVINTCITAAWHHFSLKCESVPIYNCTSGQLNPLSWGGLAKLVIKHGRDNPTKYALFYPNIQLTKRPIVDSVFRSVSQYLPSLIIDCLSKAKGEKAIQVRLCEKYSASMEATRHFTMNDWVFSHNNIDKLIEDVKRVDESMTFPVDIKKVSWDTYIKNYLMGIRKYILKENNDCMSTAKSRMKRLYWGQVIFQSILCYYSCKMLGYITSMALFSTNDAIATNFTGLFEI